jgi:hypothetical protein
MADRVKLVPLLTSFTSSGSQGGTAMTAEEIRSVVRAAQSDGKVGAADKIVLGTWLWQGADASAKAVDNAFVDTGMYVNSPPVLRDLNRDQMFKVSHALAAHYDDAIRED